MARYKTRQYRSLIAVSLVLIVSLFVSANYLQFPSQITSLFSRAATRLIGLVEKKAATTEWAQSHVANYNNLPTSPLVAELYASSPGKEIAYIDATRKLYVYSATGSLLYGSENNPSITSLFPARGTANLTALNLFGGEDSSILVPVVESGSIYIRAYRLVNVGGNVQLEPPYSTSALTTYSDSFLYTTAVVDDLDNDLKPEVFLVVPAGGYLNFYGFTWNPSSRTFLPLSNTAETGLQAPLIWRESLVSIKDYPNPAVGNVTSTSDKQVVLPVHSSGEKLTLFVFSKNAGVNTLSPVSNQAASPYYWYQEAINETVPATIQSTYVGGIALVDLDGAGDNLQEVVAVTNKITSGSSYYAVRTYKNSGTLRYLGGVKIISKINKISGTGSLLTQKIELGTGLSKNNLGAPAIGTFEGQPKSIVFKTVGSSTDLGNYTNIILGAYYSGGVLNWINNYGTVFARTSNDWVSNQCKVLKQTTNSLVTLADTTGNNSQEAVYTKHDLQTGSIYYDYDVKIHVAEGAPSRYTVCTNDYGFWDVPFFSYVYDGTNLYTTTTNAEFADVDNSGMYEALTTYHISNGYDVLRLTPIIYPAGMVPTEWPMAYGGPCRQARVGATCPPTSVVPPPSPSPIASSTPSPSVSPSPSPVASPSPIVSPSPIASPTPSPSTPASSAPTMTSVNAYSNCLNGVPQIYLSWSLNYLGTVTYLVERCSGYNCTTFTQVASFDMTQNYYSQVTWIDTNLTSGIYYNYRIRAQINGSYTPYTSPVGVTAYCSS